MAASLPRAAAIVLLVFFAFQRSPYAIDRYRSQKEPLIFSPIREQDQRLFSDSSKVCQQQRIAMVLDHTAQILIAQPDGEMIIIRMHAQLRLLP